MTATAEPAGITVEAPVRRGLDRAEGAELLGPVHGCGYRDGVCLVRRGDGQMVQLGPLMYALLECADGERGPAELVAAVSEQIGRRVNEEQISRLAQKLAAQGLLAGTEHNAPARRNPLLALRWKVLVTNKRVTSWLTAPYGFLFRPWVMWPMVVAFAAVFWFVLIHKGVAGATAQAFHSPGLLLLVFALAVVSAGFHELGHAAACRYGGATPGGMGMGLYLVWPAFYTDVTDAYRLPRRDRLRIDLAGLYFNVVVAVITMAVWLVWRVDALLLLVALQILQMVKQLSPVIRADGYHILSDATGVPDLYAHMGPTLRRLLPWRRREPSALTGWARFLVTVWVLIVVPVLISLMLGAVLLLPKIATTAWDSGQHILNAIPHQAGHGQIIDLLASLVSLVALILPVLGSALITQKIARMVAGKLRSWSDGRPVRRTLVLATVLALIAGAAWAWWPSGQYQPVRANQGGTLASLARMVVSPQSVARPDSQATPVALTPGKHLAISMIPVGGASKQHPALFVVYGGKGKPDVAILSTTAPAPTGVPTAAAPTAGAPTAGAPTGSSGVPTGSGAGSSASTGSATSPGTTSTASPSDGSASPSESGAPSSDSTATSRTATGPSGASPVAATAFPFKLPSAPGPGGTQALAVNTKNGAVKYDVAYSLVTVTKGAPVTNTNSAYAIADCKGCTTVAVSFQIVLIVGESNRIAPIDAAGALNKNCPACVTTAIADQMVITLKAAPSKQLLNELDSDLQKLNALPALGSNGTPAAIAADVAAVQQQVQSQLNGSGLVANSPSSTTTTTNQASTTTTTSTTLTTSTPASAGGSVAGSTVTSSNGSTSPAGTPQTSSTDSTTTSTTTTSSTTSTTSAPTSSSTTPTTTTETNPAASGGTATTPDS